MHTSLEPVRQRRSFDVVLIDTSPLVQLALRQILISIPGIDRVDCMYPDALANFHAHGSLLVPTDLLVLGLSHDSDGGLGLLMDACRFIRPRGMLMLTEDTPLGWVDQAAGDIPFAWLPKSASLACLDTTVHRLLQAGAQPPAAIAPRVLPMPLHRAPLPPPMLQAPADNPEHEEARQLGLTLRQYQILVQLAQGYPFKTIARALHLSESTVKTHAQTIYKRLGATSRSGAVYAARQQGATLQVLERASA
ncbi:response regulator transcription factor [Cupriavidus sp. CuC1]|uniref:response regulator transcription factor n=1 Tax=Cupriavidus sp. CuC1 TaxID=3373131 RepID=UPI0037D59745